LQTGRFERGRAVIRRPRLLERLDRETAKRIALIAAPAGFGKSVLLQAFLAAHPRRAAVLYRLGEGSRTPLGFVRGFVEALGRVGPAPALAAFVHSSNGRRSAPLRHWLLDALAGFSGTVVLDDLHLGTANRAVADFAARVIDEARQIRWIVATRSLARLPVASWIAHGDAGAVIDETELSLTDAEAAEIAAACGLADPSLTSHVAALAQGWPTAFSFGIGLAVEGYAPRGVTHHTSAFVYRVLAEQVFARLSTDQRDFLLDTCLLPSIDPQALARSLRPDAVEIVASLEQQATFISADGQGAFFYHDLFKGFLRSEFLKLPAADVNARIHRACDYLLQSGDPGAAIDLCVGLDAYGLAAESLERVGFELIDAGYVDVVERATRSLRSAELRYPIVVALDACLESSQGNYVRADELFIAAIENTSGELRATVTLRYAVDLLNRREFERADRLLASIDIAAVLRTELRADLLAVRGFAAAQGGRSAAARGYIVQALELTGSLSDLRAVAMTHHRAALAYYALFDLRRARALAMSAVRLADRAAVAGLAARARISLAVIAGEQGDLELHNRIYRELRDLAKASSDRNLMFVVLMDTFWAELEAGNAAASDELERELRNFDATPFRRSEDTLLSAYALRAAWSGDFAAAHGYVANTAARLTTPARRAQRAAESALYAVAAGLTHEAQAAEAHAIEALSALGGANGLSRTVLARCFLALALAVGGRCAEAEEILAAVTFTSGEQRKHFGAFVAAALAFARAGRDNGTGLQAALTRLRGSLLGGYATLIERLRELHETEATEIATLSASERAVLAHVERGLSSKEIAAAMSRSPQTVDTHVKAILRKLNCRGRGEAAHLARRWGLLD
jgi:LuxR family maltose regulon positive regulatory protein